MFIKNSFKIIYISIFLLFLSFIFNKDKIDLESELKKYYSNEIKFRELSKEAKDEVLNERRRKKSDKNIETPVQSVVILSESEVRNEVKKYYDKKIKFRELSKQSKDVVLNERRAKEEYYSQQMSAEDKLLLAALIIGGAAYIMSDSDGTLPSIPSTSSSQYFWDEFYNGPFCTGELIWRCRNSSNGEFASDSRCTGSKLDLKWPSKCDI